MADGPTFLGTTGSVAAVPSGRQPDAGGIKAPDSTAGLLGPLHRPTVAQLAAVYALEGVGGFGPQKFKALHDARVTPEEVLRTPSRFPMRGKRADQLRAAIRSIREDDREAAERRA